MDKEQKPVMAMRVDEETGLPLVGGPLDSKPQEELAEVPLPPKIVVELKEIEQRRGEAEANAANFGLMVLDVLRQGFAALRNFEEVQKEQKRLMHRAAVSTGVGEERVRTLDLERGTAIYAKQKRN